MHGVKEEREYRALKQMGQHLGVPIFEAFLTLEVLDKEGKRVSHHRQRSHSWVRNAYNVMFSQLAGKDADDATFGAGVLSLKETGGAVQNGSGPAGHSVYVRSATTLATVDGTDYGYRATGSEDSWGILVGTGTDAESFEDVALQTPVAEGAGSGQFSHVASEAHSVSYVAGTKTLSNELVRFFNNNSGGGITVNEVALVSSMYSPDGGAGLEKILMARDKLSSGVLVADTGQLKVTYTISLVYAG